MKAKYLEVGDFIKINNNYFEIIKIEHSHFGRGKANLNFHLRNIVNNNTLQKNFNPEDNIENIDIEKRKVSFLYSKNDYVVFLDEKNKKYELEKSKILNKINFLKKDLNIVGYFVDDELIDIKLPIKAVYKVISSPPNIKGNSEKTNTKIIILETGAQIKVPLFINVGDNIVVNTEKGEYVERIK